MTAGILIFAAILSWSMGRNSYFKFKQFMVLQERAAMKVGIDGVLLGAWARLDGASTILDVGTGTGLLALMAAQRSTALVDAVELEAEAASEAVINFQNSPWSSRIRLFVSAFQDFEMGHLYDHILSNPPFFDNSPRPADLKRAQARHADTLTLSELLAGAKTMLQPEGRISLILPAEYEERLRSLVRENGLFVNRLDQVAPNEAKKPHRLLAEISASPDWTESGLILIRHAGSASYSQQYRALTKDFYLAF
jgi:tRNA1Val (adenine37-N6)-methyltransferase